MLDTLWPSLCLGNEGSGEIEGALTAMLDIAQGRGGSRGVRIFYNNAHYFPRGILDMFIEAHGAIQLHRWMVVL